MAKTEATQPQKRRGGNNWIPAAVALVAVGLFLGWLATRTPDEAVVVAEPDADTADQVDAAADASAVAVEPADLNQAGQYVGQVVEVQRVSVMSPLGPNLFWVELPGGSPYLVKLDSAQMARGTRVPAAGANVHVIGRVLTKSDSVLTDWMERGVLQSAGQRSQAEFGGTYIEARRVNPAGN
jgi:hypothetical protein